MCLILGSLNNKFFPVDKSWSCVPTTYHNYTTRLFRIFAEKYFEKDVIKIHFASVSARQDYSVQRLRQDNAPVSQPRWHFGISLIFGLTVFGT